MRQRLVRWLSVSALGLAMGWGVEAGVGLSNARALATSADVTGNWKLSFARSNGETVETTLKLKQDGEKLTGMTTGPQGNELEIRDGKVKDGNVSFKLQFNRDGQIFVVKYSAKVEGDSLKGKIEFVSDGETRTRDFEAKRAP